MSGRLEDAFGADISRVRVHTDHHADEVSRSLGARAFTSGDDVFFTDGAYDPSSEAGVRLIAHEVFHTRQQAAGPVEGTPLPGGVVVSDPSDRSERAAEQAAAAVMDGSSCPSVTPAATGGEGTTVQRDGMDDFAKWAGLGAGVLGPVVGSLVEGAGPWIAGPVAAGIAGGYGGKYLEENTSVGTHAQETLGGFDAMMTDPGERSWMLRQSEGFSDNWDQGNYGAALSSGAKLAGGGLLGALGGIGGAEVDAASWLWDQI